MSKYIFSRHSLIILVTLFFFQCKNQEVYTPPLRREIIVNAEDSLIKAEILTLKKKVRLKEGLHYYSYYLNQINTNTSDYEGNLLDGIYIVFDENNKLIRKGGFESGLKSGVWKEWRNNGTIIRTEQWDEGVLNGEQLIYDEQEKIIYNTPYKKGVRHGKAYYYKPNSTIVTEYKNGIEVKKDVVSTKKESDIKTKSDKSSDLTSVKNNKGNESKSFLSKIGSAFKFKKKNKDADKNKDKSTIKDKGSVKQDQSSNKTEEKKDSSLWNRFKSIFKKSEK